MTTMARIFNWIAFGDEASPQNEQDNHRIHWSADLIPSLKDDHANLLKLYGEIQNMARRGQYAGIAQTLRLFKSKFDVHLLTENVKFYCYVEDKLGRRPEARETITAFRAEMNAIARSVVNFTRKWGTSGVNAGTAAAFLVELGQVGSLLVHRVEREENELYPLYVR